MSLQSRAPAPPQDLSHDRSDATPASVTLVVGAARIRVPGWWAEVHGYAEGEEVRPDDIDMARDVSAASRGSLAELDRLTLRGPRPKPARRRSHARLSPRGIVAIALLAAAVSAMTTVVALKLLGGGS